MRNLVIDIGNTRTKCGIYEHGELKDFNQFDDDSRYVSFLKGANFNRFILSSVGRLTSSTLDLIKNYPGLVLSSESRVPFKTSYRTPRTLGTDRIAGIVGGLALFPDKNILVIDAGTCITFDVVTSDKLHLGGLISPGLNMRLEALNTFTASLPLVKIPAALPQMGSDTYTSIQVGAIRGAVIEFNGVIKRYRKRFRVEAVIITGGNANEFARWSKKEIFVRPNLVLTGLNEILEFNAI